MPRPAVRVAAAHISPVLLDAGATTNKILSAITHAASHNASIIAFPESLLPGFPIWSALIPPASRHTAELFTTFASASCHADGPEIRSIRSAAKKHGISVSLGFSESKAPDDSAGRGTLWNSNLLIDAKGEVQVHHRKLRPTFYEQLSWSGGDGHGLRTATLNVRPIQPSIDEPTSNESQSFSVGTLICGENTNSLARHAILSQAQDLHISTWPAIWPTQMPEESSASSNDSSKDYDNVSANRIRAAAHCFEAKCYGMLVAAHLSEFNITDLLDILRTNNAKPSLLTEVEFALRNASRAPSMVLDSTGSPVQTFIFTDSPFFTPADLQPNECTSAQEPTDQSVNGHPPRKYLVDMLQASEGVLFADLDLDTGPLVEGKQFHDLLGGYQRFDVFELRVDRTRKDGAVVFTDV
jgi:nitrilase